MPLNSTQLWIKGLLDGLIVPGNANTLQAYITPLDPYEEDNPAAYIWPTSGNEDRQAMPRVNAAPGIGAGWKTLTHELAIWLTWFNDESDPDADISFPAVIDVVMFTLRSSANPAVIYDPLTGVGSQLIDVGERMNWRFAGIRATADQRWNRYDAEITATIIEELQS